MTTRAIGGLNSSEEREGQQMVPAHGRKQMHGPDRRNLQLRFQSMFPDSFFTRRKVEGQRGAPIHVNLIDTSTGHVVRSGPESCVKLKVVVMEGDFNNEDDDDWTQEDFESLIVKEREGKSPLLNGKVHVHLKEGVGALGDLFFTDNSSWTRSKKFRLGVKVASGLLEGIRVREAITNPFVVKDCRGEGYKKHELPALGDEVWRLKQIHRNGPFHKRLNNNGIFIVEHFLWCLGTDPKGLRTILGSSMREKMWDALVEHANTCDLRGKHYVYYADNTKNFGVVFKSICEFSGYIAGGNYNSAETLSYSQKGCVDTLVKTAYANFRDIEEYDGGMPLNIKQNEIASTSQTNVVTGGVAEYSVSFEQPAVSPPHLPPLISSKQATVNSGFSVRDYPEFFEQQISVQCQPSSVYSQPTVEDNPVSFYQQAFVPHPPYTDTVPSSQPSKRQSIRDYPDSFHPQASFQPSWIPSGQNSVNYPPVPFGQQVLVPRQPPSVPSEEAYENSTSDFEVAGYFIPPLRTTSFGGDSFLPPLGTTSFGGDYFLPPLCTTSFGAHGGHERDGFSISRTRSSLPWRGKVSDRKFSIDRESMDSLSLFQRELSEKADGNRSRFSFCSQEDRSNSHLLGSSLDLPERAGGNTVLSVGANGGHMTVGGSTLPRMRTGCGRSIPPRRGKVSERKFSTGIKIGKFWDLLRACRRLLGSKVKMEGGKTRSPLSEREEFREMASLDSKFEGLSVA